MKKVLIVDDDKDLIETVTFYLTYGEYSVRIAENCAQMFKILKEEKPDIILLDIMLPDMDGITACKHLKTDPDLLSIPVMMVTAKGKREDIESAIKAGADGYIPKPFSLSRLVERIEEILAHH
ncbi:MAG: response regulator [bacterium]